MTKPRREMAPTSRHFNLVTQDLLDAFKEAYIGLKHLAKTEPELHHISETLYKARSRCLNLLHEAKDS